MTTLHSNTKRFWANKQYVENCLEENNVSERYSVKTIGKGHRGVYLYVFEMSNDAFIEKYRSNMECSSCKIYLTKGRFDVSPIYVSVKKK